MSDTGGVLVLGAAGWIGAAVLRAAHQRGPASGVARTPASGSELSAWSGPGDLAELLGTTRARTVISCVGATEGSDETLIAANLTAVRAIGDACRRAGVRLIHLGSAAEYGCTGNANVREDDPAAPQTAYGLSKFAGTCALTDLVSSGLDVTVARPFNLVGPGQPLSTPVGEFAAAVAALPARGGEVVTGDSTLVRDFLDLARLADLLLDLVTAGSGVPLVNACSGHGVSFNDLIRTMADIRGVPVTVLNTSPGGIPRVVGDPALLHSLVGHRVPPSLRDLAAAAMAPPG